MNALSKLHYFPEDLLSHYWHTASDGDKQSVGFKTDILHATILS